MPYLENPEKLSVKETLRRAGIDDITNLMHDVVFGKRIGVPACCECSAHVEPDGKCEHGRNSVLREEGLI